MEVSPIKTEKVTVEQTDVFSFLDRSLPKIAENSILVISAKVISLLSGRVFDGRNKLQSQIEHEATYLLEPKNKYGKNIIIKFNAFLGSSGIDSCNSDGYYVLLPKDPQAEAQAIYRYLAKKFKLQKFGVIITDSSSKPLRKGAVGVAIGFWGFPPLKEYHWSKDVFGKKFIKNANILDQLAAAANLVMGESDEQTPLCIINGLGGFDFGSEKPSPQDLQKFYLNLKDDFFAQLLEKFL